MGEVMLAFDERLRRLVALKRIRPDLASNAAISRRFRREGRAVARLSHPNIVQIFDVLEGSGSAGTDTIVMEYVEGHTVRELLGGGPLDAARAVSFAEQMARGLAAAHAAGLVHRDLKAANVIVDRVGQAKIVDFGLARPLDADLSGSVTPTGDRVGTFHSMSPEQVSGGAVDHRSDLFSLGVVLFEMLSGVSPFQAATPGRTIRNLVSQPAPPLCSLVPGVAGELADLVAALLAKEPSVRPADAARVARKLHEIAEKEGYTRESDAAAPDPSSAGLGDAPTQPPRRGSKGEAPAPAGGRGAGLPSLFRAALTQRPRTAVALASSLFLAMVVALWVLRPSREPLRVAVPPPVSAAGEPGLIEVGVAAATLRGLLALERVTALDPEQIGEVSGTAVDVARAVAADEVLTAKIVGQGATDLVVLQRIRAADSGVIATESVVVPNDPQHVLLLAKAVASGVRRVYGERRARLASPLFQVPPGAYREFLEIQHRIDGGRRFWKAELGQLEALVARVPSFFDAHVLQARLAVKLFGEARDPDLLERAHRAIAAARRLDPDDPEVLLAASHLAVAEGDWPRVDKLLEAFEARVPGDGRIAEIRARAAKSRGRIDEAAAYLRSAVERRASWRNLVALADLEYRRGQVAPARRHFEAALELVPGNVWALAKLGQLELAYGDLDRAERIFSELFERSPHRSHVTNLGLVRFLRGRYDIAVESYSKALELSPEHPFVTLNLADAELARGNVARSTELYTKTLEALEELERRSASTAVIRTVRAQCLVRLGHQRQAVAIVLETLQEHPEDSEVLYHASLVLALAGEVTSSLIWAAKALDQGYPPRWFDVPGFESLHAQPAFRELLAGTHPPGG